MYIIVNKKFNMKIKLFLLLIVFCSFNLQGQNGYQCMAFSEGCWTLIGASNGVELYVTHKKVARPNMSNKGFNITVYSKIVNTNNYETFSAMGISTTFYYYDIEKKVMSPIPIIMDKTLGPKQTIVKYHEIFTNSADISYSQIKSFIYNKTQ